MSAVSAAQMRALEEAAFRGGLEAGTLMDQAGAGIAARLIAHFPRPGTAVAFIGKGNNGGDALVALDHLRAAGWTIGLRAAHPEGEWSTLSRQRLRRLGITPDAAIPPNHPPPLLLLDGLLGIGATGALRDPLLSLAREMEDLRRNHGAQVAAIDLPSGLDTDHGEPSLGCVTADLTLTLAAPKLGLFADSAVNHVGRLMLVPLTGLAPPPTGSALTLSCPENFPGLLPPRPHDFHKGMAGRVAIVAGSPGMSGAAVLTATGALHGGAGLITLHLDSRTRVQTPPEIMVRPSDDPAADAFSSAADALVIGPGLGHLSAAAADSLFEALEQNQKPVVLDADALNLLASRGRLDLLAPHCLITPHPGEFARLAPDLAKLPRAEAASRFIARHPCTLLLKGARTVVAGPEGPPRLNPTGHPGMASGGQGDFLAGVCAALLGGGNSPVDAAMLAAWVCGRAAERAVTHGGESQESLTASHLVTQLGGAFRDWREGTR